MAAERRRRTRALPRIQRETDAEIGRLLRRADRELRARIAGGGGTEWERWLTPRFRAAVRRTIEEIAAPAGEAMAAAASAAWQAGQDLVDAPIDAALALEAPRARVAAALTSPDVRQLRAMRGFLTGKMAEVTTDMANRANTQLGLIMLGVKTPSEAAAEVGRITGRTRRRARTIIRTELGRAYSTAGQERMQQARAAGLDIRKQWRRSSKLHSRPAHDAADGQVRPVDEPFIVGGERLLYPRDPSAPPAETINCGCQSLPYMASWAARDRIAHPGRRPYTDEERAAEPARADLEGQPSAPLPGAPDGWMRWRRDGFQPGREPEAVDLATMAPRVARGVREAAPRGMKRRRIPRRITLSRSRLRHAARPSKARRGAALDAADLDRVPQILARPDAVLYDPVDDALAFIAPASTGAPDRTIKIVVRPARKESLKMGRGPVESVVTSSVRTMGYVRRVNMRDPRWRVVAGSVEG